MWCHWWPTDWSTHFPATSDRWYLRQLFARWTASTRRKCSSTNTTTDVLPAWQSITSFSQVVRQYLNHKFPNQWTAHAGAQNWPPRSPDQNSLVYHVWVTWKLWCTHTRWKRQKNYSSEFSALQEAWTTLQFFVRLQVLWSHESENASKQMVDTSNILLECWKANL